MKMLLYRLFFFLGVFVSVAKGDLIDFHFGGLDQSGPAVLGSTGDVWNMATLTNGSLAGVKNTAGQATGVSVAWTSGDAWAPTKTISTAITGVTSMDAATSWLMRSCLISYQYYPRPTNLALNISGLIPNQPYTLVLFASGGQMNEGTQFTLQGNGTFTAATSGASRKISAGPGSAYCTVSVVSSTQGTLKITTLQNGFYYAVLNGFQLQSETITNSVATARKWGVCGHPTWSDYADWVPADVTTEMGYINELGCKYFRCSFEGAEYPAILDKVVPTAQTSGVTILPILPLSLTPANTAQQNYNSNYQTGYAWATYAISKGYPLPYWELGNELENDGLVSVTNDGSSPSDYPDAQPGGFVAIASGLKGAYQGIKDAYAAGRASGHTTLTPQILYGACYRHWGLLTKIQTYDGMLPCDILSWHWYGPCYGPFNQPIVDSTSASNGRTPAQCLNDFKSPANPGQPMDIWITETDRSVYVSGNTWLNGSVASNAAPQSNQDWTAQATAIQTCIDSFKTVPTVKAIFVYELFDETKADGGSTADLAAEGYFGLITGLNGTRKDAFFTFQTEIRQSQP